MKHTEILAYLAGLLDGEAYIGIKKSKPYKNLTGRVNPGYHERVQVRMVEDAGLRLLCRSLGGWLYREKSHANNGRPLWCYQASDLKAAEICRILLPYLRVKRSQARAVLCLRRSKDTARRIPTDSPCLSRWGTTMQGKQRCVHHPRTVAARERLWLLCKTLNRVGVR